MRFSVGARLVITSYGKNCEIDAEPNENRAEANADHAETSEEELPECERNQTGQQKAKCRSDQRQPSLKTRKENRADQHNRAEQRRNDIVAHAKRNFRHKSRSPGHEN